MASTFSPNLRLELIGTGEQQGTWGSTTNTNLGTLLEEAIGGYVSVTVLNSGDTTLTTVNGGADESRNMVVELTGTISANRTVICPAIEKLYVVKNSTTGGFSVTFKVSGQTGATIPNGQIYFLYVNGVDANIIVGNAASTNATNTFTENQIISVTDNTNAALRITQLGTGNALLVEDSSNPDATPLVVSNSGQLVTGHTSALSFDGTTPQVQFHGPGSGTLAGVSDSAWLASTAGPFFTFTKSRSATIGSNSIVSDGDSLGEVRFYGDDGTGFDQAARIQAFVDGTPGANDMPGRLAFLTTADGASSSTERMRINNLGNVNIGTAANPESILQITGATTPTGLMVGSISGTTLTVSSVTSGVVAVGDRVFVNGTSPDYNTYITAFGTGTGGIGTYTINNGATVAGGTTINFFPSRFNVINFVETDVTSVAGQPFGGIEWYSSDSSTPGAGVKAYVSAVSEGTSAQSSLRFGTATTTSGTQAVERMRIDSLGNVGIGSTGTSNKKLLVQNDRAVNGFNSVFTTFNGTTFENDVVLAFTGTTTNFGNFQNFPMSFLTNNSPRLSITGAGNVGVGTTSPSFLFDVNGQTAATQLVLTGSGTKYITAAASGSGIILQTNGSTEAVIVSSAGNVGVGVSPTTRFDLNGSYASNIVAVAALDINCSAGNFFTKTINANSTFTFSSVPSSRAYSFTLELTQTSGTVTWPASVTWPGGTTPSLTTNRTHLFMFVTDDGGTRWRGSALTNYTT